jgi:NADH-quinone oxidoreductase subunit K
MDVPVHFFLMLSAAMFFIGVFGFIIRRNMITLLMAVELMLNAVNINFVVFNRFLYPDYFEGFFFALFAIAIAAAETSVAIAIIINVYRKIRSIEADDVAEMKH